MQTNVLSLHTARSRAEEIESLRRSLAAAQQQLRDLKQKCDNLREHNEYLIQKFRQAFNVVEC